MAVLLPFPEGRRPAPAPAPPAAPKLRDSCYACARSKLKCNKEKPTCARCAKRGFTCEYFATKRAGRKHASRQQALLPSNGPNASTQTVPQKSQELDSSTSSTAGPPQPSPQIVDSSLKEQPSAFPDLLTPPSEATPSMNFSTEEIDAYFNSPTSFSILDGFSADILAQSNPLPEVDGDNSNNNLLNSLLLSDEDFYAINESLRHLPNSPKPHFSSEVEALNAGNGIYGAQAPSPVSPPQPQPNCLKHNCLIHALEILQKLFPNASTACAHSEEQGLGNTISQLPTIQSVVTENEQTIEAISNMLQCPCSQDAYLLTIMSLVVFKVLGWYAAAVRQTPIVDCHVESNPSKSQQHSLSHSEQVLQSPTVVGSYHIAGEDQGRMAAQLIFSELHRVQQFVNQLAHRFKDKVAQNVSTPNSAADHDTPSCNEGQKDRSPFSVTMLNQLEVDLRSRLRALSLEIVSILRQE